MNFDHTILTILLLIPLGGALLLAFLPDRGRLIPAAALAITLLTFLATLHLPAHYDYAALAGTFQFDQNYPWIPQPSIHYHLGVDGLSLWLVVLTGFLAPLGILASWNSIASRRKTFYILFLLQQVAMLGVFLSLDLFLYYAFWELSLVPMTLLIATFGRTANRRRAALRYFLYAFIPSAILLVAVVWIYTRTGTFDLPTIASQHLLSGASPAALWLASLAFLLAFAVKVPVFPLHGWLAEAIAEAPTAAVMVLAGKLGLYSILRFSFGLFPAESHRIAPLMIALGAIGIVYGALLALTQTDLKRLAAFGTLGALSFITLGIFTFTVSGLDGGIFHILSESLSGAALFLLLGFLYDRYTTYDIRDFGGLAARLPWMVTFFVIMTLSVVGLPMLNNFVGEFLILSGAMQSTLPHHIFWTTLATTGVILSAAYMLWMVQRVFYGALNPNTAHHKSTDLGPREHLVLWPLAIVFLVLGLASPIFFRAIDPAGVALARVLPQPQKPVTGFEPDTAGTASTPEVQTDYIPASLHSAHQQPNDDANPVASPTANVLDASPAINTCLHQVEQAMHRYPRAKPGEVVNGVIPQDWNDVHKDLISTCYTSPDHRLSAEQRGGWDPRVASPIVQAVIIPDSTAPNRQMAAK